MKDDKKIVKTFLFLIILGAQDESPRLPKRLETAVDLFIKMNFDVLIHVTNASGLSAFNPVEHRMAPFSHDLTGILLPWDFFGSHLDSAGNTTDPELEVKNFFASQEIVSEVLSKTVINGFETDCQAVKVGCTLETQEPNHLWMAKHVLQTRYMLMVVKCSDTECCQEFRTNWMSVFPSRFLPPPCIYKFGKSGIEAVEPSEYLKNVQNKKFNKFADLKERLIMGASPKEADAYTVPPFDLYCPSMQTKLAKCICKTCAQYWPCEAAKKRHWKACHGKNSKETLADYQAYFENRVDENHAENCSCQEEGEEEATIKVIQDFKKHLASPFITDDM